MSDKDRVKEFTVSLSWNNNDPRSMAVTGTVERIAYRVETLARKGHAVFITVDTDVSKLYELQQLLKTATSYNGFMITPCRPEPRGLVKRLLFLQDPSYQDASPDTTAHGYEVEVYLRNRGTEVVKSVCKKRLSKQDFKNVFGDTDALGAIDKGALYFGTTNMASALECDVDDWRDYFEDGANNLPSQWDLVLEEVRVSVWKSEFDTSCEELMK